MKRLEALLAQAGPSLRELGDLEVAGDSVRARLASGRTQGIRVSERDGQWHFQARVASRAVVDEIGPDVVAREVLYRNRAVPLVAFDLDHRLRLVARVAHPVATLQPDEAWLLLLTLAREADRWEHHLTGRDRY